MLKQKSHGREELSGGLTKNQKRHRKQRAGKKEIIKDIGELSQKRDEKFEGKERLAESNEPKFAEAIKSSEVKFFPSNEPKEEK